MTSADDLHEVGVEGLLPARHFARRGRAQEAAHPLEQLPRDARPHPLRGHRRRHRLRGRHARRLPAAAFNPIGVAIPNLVCFLLVGVATLFGTWEGGLVGVATENKKLTRFHDDIESGKFLILIYAFKEQETARAGDDGRRHPEAKLAGVDRHFVNPFSSPRRDAAGTPGPGRRGRTSRGPRDRDRPAGDRHGGLSLPESLVVHADRLQLGADGRHGRPDVLGHRRRVRRREPVHGVRDRALSPPQGTRAARGIRAGIQAARMVADRRHDGRRRRDARARTGRLGEVRDGARRRHRRRGARAAVGLEFPLAGRGRRARAPSTRRWCRPRIRSAWTRTTRRPATTSWSPGPELHLPIDQPSRSLLRSKDVLHDFTVPQFRVKMDIVPGMVTYLWLTPTRTGPYEILCEEMCGLGHFAMRGRVVVDDAGRVPHLAAAPADLCADQARRARRRDGRPGDIRTVRACHGASAARQPALNAPKLAGQPGWYLARQLQQLQAGRCAAAAPGDDDRRQMRRSRCTLDDDEDRQRRGHIATLPHEAAPSTVRGDAERGKSLFTTCAYCHGPAAQGIWSTNAPRLAGMSDWYLARQLKKFQQRHCAAGIRRTSTARRWRSSAGTRGEPTRRCDDLVAVHQHSAVTVRRATS